MSDLNDLSVANKLGRIEALLTTAAENDEKLEANQKRLETRLFGRDGQPDGGILSEYDKRLNRLEVWFIRVASGLVVFNFLTGSGPATFAAMLKFLGGKG